MRLIFAISLIMFALPISMPRFKSITFLAEAVITLRKNKKIVIPALTPTLNLTQTITLAVTLTLILSQTQNPNPNPNDNSKNEE